VKTTEVNNHQRGRLMQHISMRQIDAPSSERARRNLTELVASIQRVGVMEPIKVIRRGRRYRIIDGGASILRLPTPGLVGDPSDRCGGG
jgi:hypothetical protein